MGLDTVELLMAIEDEFAIKIPDSEAATILTVGDFHNCVMRHLREQKQRPNESDTFKRLQVVIVRKLGVDPEEVVPGAQIVRDLRAD